MPCPTLVYWNRARIGKAACIWISLDLTQAGPTLRVVVIIVIVVAMPPHYSAWNYL